MRIFRIFSLGFSRVALRQGPIASSASIIVWACTATGKPETGVGTSATLILIENEPPKCVHIVASFYAGLTITLPCSVVVLTIDFLWLDDTPFFDCVSGARASVRPARAGAHYVIGCQSGFGTSEL